MNDVIKSLKTTIDEITKKNISLIEDNSKISLQLEEVSKIFNIITYCFD